MIIGGAAVLLVGALVWFFLLGSREANVSGKVTLDEHPLAQAQLVFVGEAENNQAPLVAMTNDDGDYRLIGHRGAGIPPGKYKVTVSKMALKDGTVPKGEGLERARETGVLREMVPTAYTDPAKTPLVFEIRAGNNTVSIPLKKQP